MDFAALPPEINSARMYSGAGSGSLLAAAAAWDRLTRELNASAAAYQSAIAGLTTDGWRGPSSTTMANAATPYVAWLHGTAAQAEQTAGQARAAAAAYELALAAIVPPAEIAANRARVLNLLATNFFGQNSPAIAAAEAHYDAMWARDAVVMQGYQASSASASNLAPFTDPPPTAYPAATPTAAAAPTFSITDVFNDTVSSASGAASVTSSSFGGASIATTNHAITVNAERDAVMGVGPFLGRNGPLTPNSHPPAPVAPPTVLAAMGRASIAGTLSVPQTWAATPAPAASFPAPVLPATATADPPPASAVLPPGMFGEAMLGTLAGRGISNTAAKLQRPSVIPRSPAAG